MLVATSVLELFSDRKREERCDEVLYGHEVFVSEQYGEDVLVETKLGNRGFLKKKDLLTDAFLSQPADVVCRADVLVRPDIKSACLFTLPRFSRVEVLERGEEYCRVCLLDGRSGFVRTCRLRFELPAPTADNVISVALSLLGHPYRWGGRSDRGVDCSGLIALSFSDCGLLVPRDTCDMKHLKEVPPTCAKRGDLALFSSHVGLLLTDTNFVHASEEYGAVCFGSLCPTHPLYDARHVEGGYTIHRVEGLF